MKVAGTGRQHEKFAQSVVVLDAHNGVIITASHLGLDILGCTTSLPPCFGTTITISGVNC